MNATETKEFIREYTDEVWNRGDVDAIERYYAPDYVHHDVSRPDVRTLEDYKQWARDLHEGLSSLHVRIEDVIAEDGKAVKRWTATGTHDHALAGIPATGKRVSFSGTSTYRFEGGRIAECWYVYDLLGLLQQLDVIPAPEAATA